MNKVSLEAWIIAARPKTLAAAVMPVMVATFMAIGDGVYNPLYALIALTGAVLIQIGTNLANDYFDYKKGADVPERKGPLRVTQSGLIEPQIVLSAALIVLALSGICYFFLVIRGGWPIAILGLIALLSAVFYTAGPYPLGYIGLGEVFVLFFFGPVALAGTYYLQSLELNIYCVMAGLGCGFLSAAILVVNNLRDIDTDRKCGKKTLAVRFGRVFSKIEYASFIALASIMPMIIYSLSASHLKIIFSSLIIILAAPLIRIIATSKDAADLNVCLEKTAKLLVYYGILFSIGWNI